MANQIIHIRPQFSGRDACLLSSSQSLATDLASGADKLTFSTTSRVIAYFPLRKIPHSFTLSDAALRFFVISGSVQVAVHAVTADWDRHVTYLSRKTSTAWTTPGGDFSTTLFTATLAGTNAFATIGAGEDALRDQVNRWLTEFDPNYGLLFIATSGSAQTYAMNEAGAAWTEQSDTTVTAAERWTKYHPDLMLTGTSDQAGVQSFVQGNVNFRIEPRATRYSLVKPTSTLPVTLSAGIPYLDNPQPMGDLVESFAVRRARSSLDAKIDITVTRDKSDAMENAAASRQFFYPMELIEFRERIHGIVNSLRPVTVGMAVIDGDRENRQEDISTIQLQCRDPAMYGLISSFEGKFLGKKIPVPLVAPIPPAKGGVGLSRRDSNVGYWIFYSENPTTKEQARNWVADPTPTVWVQNGTSKKFYSASDQLQFKHGLGEIWIEKEFFAAATNGSPPGMGAPSFGADGNLRITFLRWADPLDDFMGSLPLNVAIATVLKDAGYHHLEDAGYLYLKELPPVLADFVFDQVVYLANGSAALDYTTIAQHESGATLQISPPILNHVGDALYFKLDQANGRFNWIWFIPYQPAIGGTYVWEIETGGTGTTWTAITPFTDPEDPEAWLRGLTDPGAYQLQAGGLITFKETQLTNWTIAAIDFSLVGVTNTTGFWMRVRCTGVPTQAAIIHRWAGKEVLTVGKDKQSSVFRHYDENHHFELCEQMLHRWGVPNYLVQVDRFGDVVGKYLVQKATPDYELTDLSAIEIARDSTQIYTEVRVLVKQFNNESLIDYASLIQGAVPIHTPISFVDNAAPPHDLSTADYYHTHPGGESADPAKKLTFPIDDSADTAWGLWYRVGGANGGVDTSQIFGVPVYEIDFVTTISIMGMKIYTDTDIRFSVEGYNPDTASWVVLPGCSDLGGRGPKSPVGPAYKDGPIDFTSDPSPDRPIASKVRVLLIGMRQNGRHNVDGIDYYDGFDFWFYQFKVFGIAQGEVLEGIAILGTTPPFNTDADQALMARYGRRVFAVQNNPYITTQKEANRVALDVLRELARLYDPLVVNGIYPLSELGETVRVRNADMGIDQTYLVEEFDRSPWMEYRALLTDYRFSSPSDPGIPVIPNRTNAPTALEPSCVPLAADGIGVSIGPVIWFRADDMSHLNPGAEIRGWTSAEGQNYLLGTTEGRTGGFLHLNFLNGLPVVEFDSSSELVTPIPLSKPLHLFMVAMQISESFWPASFFSWGPAESFSLQKVVGAPQVAAVGDTGQQIALTTWPLSTWGIVEIIFNGASSAIALNGGAYGTGDLGSGNGTDFGFGFNRSDVAAAKYFMAEFKAYDTVLDATERATVLQELRDKWGLS